MSEKFRNLKLTLVEQTLQSNYTRNQLRHVSIHQFINRVSLLFQKPRVFLLYKKEEGKWFYIFGTYKDVLYQNKFDNLIKNLHNKNIYNPGGNQSDEFRWPDAPLAIGDTRYGIIIASIERRGIDYNDIDFRAVCENEYELLQDLWGEFLNCEYSRDFGVKERLEYLFKNVNRLSKGRIPSVVEEEVLTKKDNDFIEGQIVIVKEIVNEIYKDIYNTPLICNKGKTPPNLFFFLRYYGEASTLNRFKNGVSEEPCNAPYPYSLRMIIPEMQNDHLRETVANIKYQYKNNEFTDDSWNYKYERMQEFDEMFKAPLELETNSRYPNKRFDELFLKNIIEKGTEDDFINILEKPYGKNARSMVDPAIMSGYVQYRPSIFVHSGLERVTKIERKEGFDSPDVKRLISLHYLLSAAAPESNYETLGAITVPLFVNSQTYMAVVHANIVDMTQERSKEEDEKKDGKIEKEKKGWVRNYHFFSDIGRHCARKLRYISKSRYKGQLATVLADAFYTSLTDESIEQGKNVIPYLHIEKITNHYYDLLCRVWSYPKIKIGFSKGSCADTDTDIKLFPTKESGAILSFVVLKNPYYFSGDEEQDGNYDHFLSESEVKTVLQSVIRNEITSLILNVMNRGKTR